MFLILDRNPAVSILSDIGSQDKKGFLADAISITSMPDSRLLPLDVQSFVGEKGAAIHSVVTLSASSFTWAWDSLWRNS